MAFEVPRQPMVSGVPVELTTSTGTTINSYGIQKFSGSSAAKSWKLAAPVAGRPVGLLCLDGATGAIQKITSTGVDFVSTDGAKSTLSFNHDYESCMLVGLDSTRYWVMSRGAIASS